MRTRLWVGGLAAGLSLCLFSSTGTHGQQKLDRLVVPLTDVSINKVPYVVAQDAGLFKKYGLDVQLFITPGAAKKGEGDGMAPAKELTGGPEGQRSDLSTGGGVGLTVGKARRGGDQVILATTDSKLRWQIYARPEIKTLAQLKGKRLGVTGTSSCTGLIGHILADRMKWEVGKDLILVTRSEERLDGLKENAIDAVIMNELGNIHALKLGLKPLAEMSEWGSPFLCSGVSASSTWLKQPGNRDKALRFLKATLEGIALMHKNDPVTMKALGHWWGVPDREIQRRMLLTGKEIPRKPYPAVDGIKLVMRLYDSPEMRKYKAEDFYDDTLMRELDKSGFIDNLYK